jgi:uncharacterized membrane protein YecN with MAPEG domain
MATPLYIALLALLFLALSLHVIRARRQFGAALGHDASFELLRRVRAQGNFAEYSLFFLLLLAAAEMRGLPLIGAHVFGLVFLAGRIMHAYSLLKAEPYEDGRLTAKPIWRMRGMVCTLACIGLLALIVIGQTLWVTFA